MKPIDCLSEVARRKPRILVIGDIMIDEYVFGIVSRISPEAPVAVLRVTGNEFRLGGAANVAANISALGARPVLLGHIGDDVAGDEARSLLDRANVETLSFTEQETPTTRKSRIMAQQHHIVRIDSEVELSAQAELRVLGLLEKLEGDFDAVVLSDYEKGVLRRPNAIVSACRRLDVPILADSKKARLDGFSNTTLVKLNEAEFRLSAQMHGLNPADFQNAAAELRRQLKLGSLLVTCAQKGMSLFSQNSALQIPATVRSDPVDVVGAGDTVMSTFAVCLASGISCKVSAQIAGVSAGLAVMKSGAVTVAFDELSIALSARHSNTVA